MPKSATGPAFRERDAIIHGDVAHRDERNDVGGAHARVLALMPGEIDPVPRDTHGAKGRFGGGVRRGHERKHGAVMGSVRLYVEQPDARYRRQGGAQRLERSRVTAF